MGRSASLHPHIGAVVKIIPAIIGALAISAVVSGSPVDAMASTSNSVPGVGIAVSPTRVELHASPGKPVHQQYMIQADNTAIRVTASEKILTESSGGFSVSAGNIPASVSGISWARLPGSFTLEPHQRKTVTVTITEPKHSEPGQRSLATVFEAVSLHPAKAANGLSMALVNGVAGEQLVDVPGPVRHDTVFGLDVPTLNWSGTVPVTISAHDKGTVYDLLNSQKVTVNGEPKLIGSMFTLAGATQTVHRSVSLPTGIDHVSYAGQNKVVYVLPGRFILYALGLIVLVLGVWLLARRSGARSARKAA